MTTGATRMSVSATTPMNANVRRVWNDWGTVGRSWRESRAWGSQPESKRWPSGAVPCAGAAGSGPRTSATSVLGELVAGAPNGQHELRHGGIVLDLLAQVAHVDVDGLLVLVECLVVAEQLEQLAAREDPPGLAREVTQDLELGRGEPDPPRAPLNAPALEVDHEVSVADDPAAGRVREIAVRPPEERPDAAQELAKGERLGHVVVGAELEAHDLVELVAARREEQHRRLGARRAEAAQHLEPVDARELHVEDDEVRCLGRGVLQALLARARDGNLVP